MTREQIEINTGKVITIYDTLFDIEKTVVIASDKETLYTFSRPLQGAEVMVYAVTMTTGLPDIQEYTLEGYSSLLLDLEKSMGIVYGFKTRYSKNDAIQEFIKTGSVSGYAHIVQSAYVYRKENIPENLVLVFCSDKVFEVFTSRNDRGNVTSYRLSSLGDDKTYKVNLLEDPELDFHRFMKRAMTYGIISSKSEIYLYSSISSLQYDKNQYTKYYKVKEEINSGHPRQS